MKRVWLGALLGVLLLACSEQSTDPAPPGFSASFQVKTAAGQPVEGLRVSAWSVLSTVPVPPRVATDSSSRIPPPTSFQLYQNYPNPFEGTTSIRFDMPVLGDYVLRSRTVAGRSIDQWTGDDQPAGSYVVDWAPPDTISTAYWIHLEAGPDATPDYVDSICAIAWYPDATHNIIGFTNAQGVVETRDSTRFAHLFGLPDIPRTSAGGPDTIGMIQITDSIKIVVVDTAAASTEFYGRRVSAGHNAFELIW